MSSTSIELHILGQALRLSCPEDQHQALRLAAEQLEARVAELRERTGIIQLEKVLSVVALNLSYELMQQQQQNDQTENRLVSRIQQLDNSLARILAQNAVPATDYKIQ